MGRHRQWSTVWVAFLLPCSAVAFHGGVPVLSRRHKANVVVAATAARESLWGKGKEEANNKVVFIFPGQGSQWPGCGRELYETEPVFRRTVDKVDAEWVKLTGNKLSTIAFDCNANNAALHSTGLAQPVTFLLQIGLLEMLRHHGIHPTAVLGHSAGESVAAYAAGAYTLEEACYGVYHGSRIQQTLAPTGRMLVLMQDCNSVQDVLQRYGLEGDLAIACINSPKNTVVCGTDASIATLQDKLAVDGLPTGKLLAGDMAFHSKHMLPVKDELLQTLGIMDGPEPRTTTIPMISTVTGKIETSFDAHYWWRQVREPVDLMKAMETVRKLIKPTALIELSPHITLRSPIRDCYKKSGDEAMPTYIHSLIRNQNTAESFAHTITSCYEAGVCVDFKDNGVSFS